MVTLAPEETRLRKYYDKVAVPRCMGALLYTFHDVLAGTYVDSQAVKVMSKLWNCRAC